MRLPGFTSGGMLSTGYVRRVVCPLSFEAVLYLLRGVIGGEVLEVLGFNAVSIFGYVVSSIWYILLCVSNSLFFLSVVASLAFIGDVVVNCLIPFITSLDISISVRFWALG